MSQTHEALAAPALAEVAISLINTIKEQVREGQQAGALANLDALKNAMESLGGGL